MVTQPSHSRSEAASVPVQRTAGKKLISEISGERGVVPPCAAPSTGECYVVTRALRHELTRGETAAHHTDQCRECQAALIACLRRGCQRAPEAFAPLVDNAANKAVCDILAQYEWPMSSVEVEEAVGVARDKGWDLISRHASCNPIKIMASEYRTLSAFLVLSMRRKVIDWRRKQTHRLRMIFQQADFADPTAEVPSPVDPGLGPDEIAMANDEVRVLRQAVSRYRATLLGGRAGEAKQAVFDVWLHSKLTGDRLPSQEAIAADIRARFDVSRHQSAISRWIDVFPRELAASLADPASGVDEQTQATLRRLLLETESRGTINARNLPLRGDNHG